ncbi:IS630 transposase-related protein [Geodermatophilus chilensis]|uniref:IS630 transposase-related protein n=1 Tax=Geodermatophilus chilensis TaxID=2035835 RepID=UPI000D528B99|nr:helix-turn-helix domain-containing protein [Geodermatophilus chilensis]
MRAYSVDLREKLLAAVDAGMSREQASSVFGVSVPSIERYVRLRRQTGSLAPRRAVKPGPPAVKGEAVRAWLPGRLEQSPDATLAEHAAAFTAATGTQVSPATVFRAIGSLPEGRWTLKKDGERG